MSRHTEGPWYPSYCEETGFLYVDDDKGHSVCECMQYSQTTGFDIDQTKANAELIAKAPEMLELLRKIFISGEVPFVPEWLGKLLSEDKDMRHLLAEEA